MALGDLTKQIAQQALLSATTPKENAAPAAAPDNPGLVFLGQINSMQKALKDDEELAVFYHHGAERLRVMEIFVASRQVAVLSGVDTDRVLTRVIAALDSLQLVCKVMRVAPGAKAARVGLISPKAKDSNG